jgi:hypothetical protein
MTINIHLNNAFHSIIVGAIHELPDGRIKTKEKTAIVSSNSPKI